MPYVNQRWLGGMLTNFQTVHKRLQRLKELEDLEQTGALVSLSKKEQLVLSREKAKLERSLGGIRDMQKVPSAIWIVDTKKEHIAVGEARKLSIPVVAILDTNCDPDEVDYKIPGNDDAIRSIAVLTRVIADAVAEGLMARSAAQANAGREDGAEPAIGGDEPLADWERELLTGGDAADAGSRGPAGRRGGRRPRRPLRAEVPLPPRPLPRPSGDAARPGLIARRRPRQNGRGRRRGTPAPTVRSSTDRPRGSDMAEFTAADVKRLRDATGAGMMDCKKALTEADGDYDKAVEFLRVKGAKDVGKRLERSTTNGIVVSKDGALLELDCETDFVAKNADFVKLAERLLDIALQTKPADAEALLATEVDGQTVGRARRGRVRPHRREAGAEPVRRLRGHRPRPTCTSGPPTCPRPSVSRCSTPVAPRRPRAAWRCTSPPRARASSPARRSRPRRSRPSVASPSRPPRRRASPSRRSSRSSRAG